jgi:phosphate/sulfate permease
MEMQILFFAVLLLAGFAVFDLVVGVSNDAANFLSSSLGSRAAPTGVIMAIATLGLLVGVLFSSGMMEVARKGIFTPGQFTMPELICLFCAVMLTDIILLDVFNAHGLPTSTTVSIVFELLGAAVALSLIKISAAGASLGELVKYINSSRALLIIAGILLSVVVAFTLGAIVQFITRLIFTFDYKKRLKRYGGVWGGVATACITYFILIKGAKGATFIPDDVQEWIRTNAFYVIGLLAIVSSLLLQALVMTGYNIMRPIVLFGTFALAMAFAANDLVNFIGVPMAGWHAYEAAAEAAKATAGVDPLTVDMSALADTVPSQPFFLLLAGAIMAVTLIVSRKARTVTATTVDLGQQSEREDWFESSILSRAIVRIALNFGDVLTSITPAPVRKFIASRLTSEGRKSDSGEAGSSEGGETKEKGESDAGAPPFDLLRAAVNLMVASIVISYATSFKLPLSTTYVTFMVAMGASFADQAWGRDSAVYRVAGVITVVGGWFLTAVAAFTVSGLFATIIYYTSGYGVLLLFPLASLLVWRNHSQHAARYKDAEVEKIFNLQHVEDATETIKITFTQVAWLLRHMRESLNVTLDALFEQKVGALSAEKRRRKNVQRWSNIILANLFKSLRLLQAEKTEVSVRYGQIARLIQKLADGHRDIVMRASDHVLNNHKGLLDVQVGELREVKVLLNEIISGAEQLLEHKSNVSIESVREKDQTLKDLVESLSEKQIVRVGDNTSKTRLSILYFAITGNAVMMSKQTVLMLKSFKQSFGGEAFSDGFEAE